MYLLLKMVVSHCYVSLPEGKDPGPPLGVLFGPWLMGTEILTCWSCWQSSKQQKEPWAMSLEEEATKTRRKTVGPISCFFFEKYRKNHIKKATAKY